MRYGFTTGSCAAAAAKAAAYMLLIGREKTEIVIDTPKGIPYRARITDIHRSEARVRCAVVKDGGDDPDITTGSKIVAEVSFREGKRNTGEPELSGIVIVGGAGIGVVTRPGLNQPVGAAAINEVPRQMIQKEVAEVCALADYHGGLTVELSVPEGEKLAARTFNPRLGIIGGISILGTSGIVEPMSTQALLDSIRLELRQRRAEGRSVIAAAPGNYGLEYMKRTYGYDLEQSVKCSNFIGDTVDMAAECGFSGLLLTGHIGKLVKAAGGMLNTHSREGDCRAELMAAAALRAGADADTARDILACAVTEEAVQILREKRLLEPAMRDLMEKIMFHLKRRADGRLAVECILYSSQYGSLAESDGAKDLLCRVMEEK